MKTEGGSVSAGAPQARTVTLRDAERELRQAWRTLDEETRRGGGEGMLRLREVNLVVVCPEVGLEQARRTAALVTRAHPARSIVIVLGAGGAESASAEITTACLVDVASGHHVCSEEVLIRGGGGEDESVQTAVLQLLVPDVPVVGWWARDPAGPPGGLAWLARISDRVVSDLRLSRDPVMGLHSLGDLITDDGGVGLRELEWLRFMRWRVLTADLFEQRENQALIPSLTHLEVEHDHAPMQAVLYGAWFASRLGLAPGEAGWWGEDGFLCMELVARRGVHGVPPSLVLRLAPRPEDELERGSALTAVRMRSRPLGGEPESESVQALSLSREPGSCLCCAVVGSEEDALLVKSFSVAEEEDHYQLSRVIDSPVRDSLLHEALVLAGEMTGRPGFAWDALTGAGAETPAP